MAESVSDTATLDADLETVLDVVRDIESYPQWQDDFRSADVLETDDRGRPVRARLTVDARLFTTTMTLRYEHTETSLAWSLVEGDQLRRNDGAYELDAEGDRTRVTYRLEVEPAVRVPGMLRRRAARHIVRQALEGLRERVATVSGPG